MDCNECKRTDVKCCSTCKKNTENCNVWHICGSDCPKYEIRPRTNSERIRSMSDEELADFLINFKNDFGEEYEGQQSCLQWLLEGE